MAAQQSGVDINTVSAAPSEVQAETRGKNVSQSTVRVRQGENKGARTRVTRFNRTFTRKR